MTILVVIALIAVVVVLDVIPLFRSGEKKEGWVHSVMLGISLVVLSLYAFGIPVPSPMAPVETLIKQITGQ